MSIESITQTPKHGTSRNQWTEAQIVIARCAALQRDIPSLAAIAQHYYDGITRVATNTTLTAAEEAGLRRAEEEAAERAITPPMTDLQYKIGYLAARRAIVEAKVDGNPTRYLEHYDRITEELSELPAELVDKHYQHDLGFLDAQQAE